MVPDVDPFVVDDNLPVLAIFGIAVLVMPHRLGQHNQRSHQMVEFHRRRHDKGLLQGPIPNHARKGLGRKFVAVFSGIRRRGNGILDVVRLLHPVPNVLPPGALHFKPFLAIPQPRAKVEGLGALKRNDFRRGQRTGRLGFCGVHLLLV